LQLYVTFIARYSEKIAKLSDHIYQIGINASKLFEDEFINHGDFQMNNILFKYNNDGKPIDYILVSTITLLKNYVLPLNTSRNPLIYCNRGFMMQLRLNIKICEIQFVLARNLIYIIK